MVICLVTAAQTLASPPAKRGATLLASKKSELARAFFFGGRFRLKNSFFKFFFNFFYHQVSEWRLTINIDIWVLLYLIINNTSEEKCFQNETDDIISVMTKNGNNFWNCYKNILLQINCTVILYPYMYSEFYSKCTQKCYKNISAHINDTKAT